MAGSELDIVARIRRRLPVRTALEQVEFRPRPPPPPPVDVNDLIALLIAIVRTRSTTVEAVRSETRVRRVAYPRQLFCYMARWELGATLTEIGAVIRRDHTTVLYGYNLIRRLVLSKLQSPEVLEVQNDIYWIKAHTNIEANEATVRRSRRRMRTTTP